MGALLRYVAGYVSKYGESLLSNALDLRATALPPRMPDLQGLDFLNLRNREAGFLKFKKSRG